MTKKGAKLVNAEDGMLLGLGPKMIGETQEGP